MGAAFAWIGYIVEWFGRLIPRIKIVRATDGGVKFCHGSLVKEIKPGLTVYWPLTAEIEVTHTVRHSTNLPTQVLVTKDHKSVAAGAVVVYSIDDVVKALSETYGFIETIGDITQTAIVKVISSKTLADLISEINGKVVNELTQAVQSALKPYGVRVHRCALSDFAPCRVIRLIGEERNG